MGTITVYDELGNVIRTEETAENESNDDSGRPTTSGESTVQAAGNTEVNTPSVTDAASLANSGSTIAGKAGSNIPSSTSVENQFPTPRRNPLGYCSSYTYQATLYLLTPDALNAFKEGGRKNIANLTNLSSGSSKGGAYIIAQSGGVNNTTDKRAPGFDLDFYLDNISITTALTPGKVQASSVTTDLSFSIIEPYGFSFLNRLKEASDVLVTNYSKTINIKSLKNSSRQFFVLGIRFQGYDKHGNLLTGKETFDGKPLDPSGSGNGLFQHFYELMITKMSFKIDGKTTVYNVEASSVSKNSMSIQNATVPCQVTIEAGTVDEALQGPTGLFTHINNYYQEMVKNKQLSEPVPKFKVEYVGDISDLKDAILAIPEDNTKYLLPMQRGKNDTLGVKAVPDFTKRQISFSNQPAVSILAAIEKIIQRSSFLRNALKENYTNTVSPNDQSKSEETTKINPRYFRWYNITTNVKILGYNTDENKFVYETTYVICPYEVPILLSTYVNTLPKYKGPVKRYDYWFTGKNSEIIHYEQVNNNGYFIVALNPSTNKDKQKSQLPEVPVGTGLKQNADSTGKLGAAGQADGSVPANLYDPESYAEAKITILGDPDFLVNDSLNYDAVTKTFNQYYAPDGYTINPTGGQVFVEVDFKEGTDYKYGTGLMNINDSITFWQYPESVKKVVKGVSYLVTTVTSKFKGGKFTQDLDMNINILTDSSIPSTPSTATRDENQSAAETARLARYATGARTATGSTVLTGTNSTTDNTGLKEDPVVSENSPSTPQESNQSPDDPGTTSNSPTTEEDGGRE